MSNEHPTADERVRIISQLCKFYEVGTLEDLVLAQDRHIERLQEKLPRDPDLFPRKLREG